MEIPLSRPEITESDIEAVVAVLRTPHLSLGPKLPEFEAAFARYIGVPHAVALNSGTAGLHLGLLALGIGPGDEVIVPSFAFIAAANAIRHTGATPVFADIHPVTLNLTADSIQRALTPQTRAILLVHTFGYPADLHSIGHLAHAHGLYLIEDACEAIGAEYHAQKIGSFGHFGVFSFYPNKPITTGEGGIVVTRDTALARTLRALRNQGRLDTDGWLEHSLLGYNCRLSELSCALGLSQLQKLDDILARRATVAAYYFNALPSFVTPPPKAIENGRLSWFTYVVRLPPSERDQIAAALTAQGIGCRAYFPPIHRQPLYADPARPPLPVTDQIAATTLALPFFNALTQNQVQQVCQALSAAHKADSPQTATAEPPPSNNPQ
jgi:perosamine synthetase